MTSRRSTAASSSGAASHGPRPDRAETNARPSRSASARGGGCSRRCRSVDSPQSLASAVAQVYATVWSSVESSPNYEPRVNGRTHHEKPAQATDCEPRRSARRLRHRRNRRSDLRSPRLAPKREFLPGPADDVLEQGDSETPRREECQLARHLSGLVLEPLPVERT